MSAIVDYIGATFTHLRSNADITALAGARVSGSIDKWPKLAPGQLTYGVLVLPSGGTEHADLRHILPRIDIWCFGPDRRTAMLMWRTVYGFLMDNGSFKVNGVLVYSTQLEGGPNYVPDPDRNWPRVIGSFILRVAAHAVV